MMNGNPFRVGGTVAGSFFTDRADEVERIAAALSEPQAKLLVYGARRMGKSSAIERAVRSVRRKSRAALMIDLSSVTTFADIASRLLQAAARQLPRSWKDVVSDLVSHLRVGVSVVLDPAGQPTLVLDVGQRSAPLETQQTTLAQALDAIDRLAGERKRTIGIVLDEFQEIHRLGGEEAEWHLRGTIQGHKNLSYVFAGSRESLIREMTRKQRAFYKLFEMMPFGPIDEDHLARWIDSRLESHGVESNGSGRPIVELARPRTRDIVQLARAAFQVGARRGRLGEGSVERALDRAVDEEEDLLRAEWDRRTALQQNVLRAIAGGEQRLFSESVRDRSGLRGSAYVAAALEALVEADVVVRHGEGDYDFDSPFMRRWVERSALPDVWIDRSTGPS